RVTEPKPLDGGSETWGLLCLIPRLGRTTPLSSRGGSVSYESQEGYMPPRSAAADGSARPATTSNDAHSRPGTLLADPLCPAANTPPKPSAQPADRVPRMYQPDASRCAASRQPSTCSAADPPATGAVTAHSHSSGTFQYGRPSPASHPAPRSGRVRARHL